MLVVDPLLDEIAEHLPKVPRLVLDGVELILVTDNQGTYIDHWLWHMPGCRNLTTAAVIYHAVSTGQSLNLIFNR